MFTKKPKLVEIAPGKAAQSAKAGTLTLVDVREASERAAVQPGVKSLHIPLGSLSARIGELPTDRPVAFVCAAGGRSAKAARIAHDAGLEAWNVTGGMSAWAAGGAPIKAGR
jgi:rhodanese-related sulfurtransferase